MNKELFALWLCGMNNTWYIYMYCDNLPQAMNFAKFYENLGVRVMVQNVSGKGK